MASTGMGKLGPRRVSLKRLEVEVIPSGIVDVYGERDGDERGKT